MSPPFAPAARHVDIRLDDARRWMRMTISGQASGPEVAEALCACYEAAPRATGYDYLIDLSAYEGDVCAGDLQVVAQTYARLRGPAAEGARTAFVTSDPFFRLWAEAMDFQFPGRTHTVFPDAQSAQAFLATEPAAA